MTNAEPKPTRPFQTIALTLTIITIVFAGCAMILNPANTRFSQTLETSASPETIWTIWTNVQAWPTWDTELEYAKLEYAKLEGPFALGAKGKLKAKGNQEAEFVITTLEPGRSYTLSTILPMNSSLNV